MRRVLATLFVMALLAGGCQQPTQSGSPETPVRGGTLVVGIAGVDLTNPGTTTSPGVTYSQMLIYQALVSVDSDLVPRPELAESFETEDNGATYRFKLRKTQWHDGRPFTSADVKFTFEKILLEFHPRTRQSLRTKIKAIETPDDQTVIFRLNAPFSAFPLSVSFSDAPILPKHLFEGSDPKTNPVNEKPVGTGPFMFGSYQKGAELRLRRNPDFFREGLPYLNEIVFRVIPEESGRVQALEREEIDIMTALASEDLRRLSEDPEFRVGSQKVNPTGGNCSRLFGFNLDRPPFNDQKLRAAIAHGFNRERLVKQARFGFGRVQTSPIHSGIEWAHADVDYPEFDLEEAGKLLTEAGWIKGADGKRIARGVTGVAEGTPLRFELLVASVFLKYAEIIRDDFAAIGVEVVPVPLEVDLVGNRVFVKREFETYLALQCQGVDPEIGVRRSIHSSGIVPIPFTNGPAYRNSDVDKLLDEAAAELDQEERARAYSKIQEILTRDLPYVWLVEEDGLYAESKACRGIRYDSVHLVESAYCRS